MKAPVKTVVSWRFCDASSVYPDFPSDRKIYVRSPEDVFKEFSFLFVGQVRERFVILWLNSANRVMGFEVVTEGTLNSSLVHPREVFRGAIVSTSAAIIAMHNHPSGNPEPSQEDIAITKQLVDSGKIIGIPVHDHVIFAESNFTSFADRGLI